MQKQIIVPETFQALIICTSHGCSEFTCKQKLQNNQYIFLNQITELQALYGNQYIFLNWSKNSVHWIIWT